MDQEADNCLTWQKPASQKHTCQRNERKGGKQESAEEDVIVTDRQLFTEWKEKKKHSLGKWRLHFSGFAEAASQELWTPQTFCESWDELRQTNQAVKHLNVSTACTHERAPGIECGKTLHIFRRYKANLSRLTLCHERHNAAGGWGGSILHKAPLQLKDIHFSFSCEVTLVITERGTKAALH